MQPGDEFRATIRVYWTGGTTCGGGREFEDVAHGNYNFDEGEFDSLVPVPKQLPTKPGSVIEIETLDRDKPIIALLREDGTWVTNRAGALEFMNPSDIQDTRWRSLT